VSATTEAGSTTATTRDPNGALIGLRSGTSRSYYLLDGLGSVVALTDGSGAVTHSYSYDPYGVTTETTSSAVANPWRYTGQYQDTTTGLYKMGARYYQPELGRWTQPDPSGLDANAYLYVGGNPVNFVDPSGLSSFGDFFGAIADIAGVVSAFAGLACAGGVGCPFAVVAEAISTVAAAGETAIECNGGDECDAAAAGLLASSVGIGAKQAGFIPASVLAGFVGVANDFTAP
jgi:RHS repeat-associated protein